jgi:hypothetical protein
MSNEVAPFSSAGGMISKEDLAAGLENLQRTTESVNVPYLRMQRDGVFCYGAEKIEVDEDSEWAINPASLQHGWACWSRPKDDTGKALKGELLGEDMVPFHQQPVPKSSLPDHGWPWTEQVAMMLKCLSGNDEGVQVIYKGTSLGLKQAVHALTTALREQLARDPQHIVPVVVLDNDSYAHKEWGKTYTPVLRIVRWVDYEGHEADKKLATTEADPADGEASPPRRRRRRG